MVRASYKGSGKLLGRKALITGGDFRHRSGRGNRVSLVRGADVAFGYLPEEEPDAQEVIQLIKAGGDAGQCRFPRRYPATRSFCRKLVADAVAGLGGLDILVSNAGQGRSTASHCGKIRTQDMESTFKTNVFAMVVDPRRRRSST